MCIYPPAPYGQQAAEGFACLPFHLLIACLEGPQPDHLTNRLWSYEVPGTCLPVYSNAREVPFDFHLAWICNPSSSNMPKCPFDICLGCHLNPKPPSMPTLPAKQSPARPSKAEQSTAKHSKRSKHSKQAQQ